MEPRDFFMKQITNGNELFDGQFYWLFDKSEERYRILQYLSLDLDDRRDYFTNEDDEAFRSYFIYGPVPLPGIDFVQCCNEYVEEQARNLIQLNERISRNRIEDLKRDLEKSENSVSTLCNAMTDMKDRYSSVASTAHSLSRQIEIGKNVLENEIEKRDSLKAELESLDPVYFKEVYA